MVAGTDGHGAMSRTRRAGTPTTTVLGATSMVTTEPAPTTAPSRMVTPGRMVTFAPDTHGCWAEVGPTNAIQIVVEGRDDGVVPDECAVTDVDSALVLEPATAVDEDPLAESEDPAEVTGEGREQPEGVRNLRAGEGTHESHDLLG